MHLVSPDAITTCDNGLPQSAQFLDADPVSCMAQLFAMWPAAIVRLGWAGVNGASAQLERGNELGSHASEQEDDS